MSRLRSGITKRVARPATHASRRATIFFVIIIGAFCVITGRLAYWQIWKAAELSAIADAQYHRNLQAQGVRGSIYFQNGEPLVVNQRVYTLFAQPHLISWETKPQVAASLAAQLIQEVGPIENPEAETQVLAATLLDKLQKDRKWIALKDGVPEETFKAIAEMNLPHIGFDPHVERFYPEASLAAQLLGFVGKNDSGEDTGYFGIEGALDKELRPRTERTTVLADALGTAFMRDSENRSSLDGRTITLTIRRDVQAMVERLLQSRLDRYAAESGEIVVLDPETGAILALASLPTFSPKEFRDFDPNLYRNSSVSDLYEPGSTFKVLTVAAGIDTGVISADTTCPVCAGPRTFGQYQIKTWNEQYHPNITMQEAVAKSDNTAMIFIAEKLGSERFRSYLDQFGIGQPLGIEVQGDIAHPLPETWRPVELATRSFGQGIVTTSLQLTRAIGAIANDGVLQKTRLIQTLYDPITDTSIETPVETMRTVISPESARTMTDIMVYAAQKGEAQWTYRADRTVAGKTGTSQIAAKGGYDEDRTIASFVGFAPAYDAKFVMLVKLVNPGTSPWAAETAAPLWYDVAEQLYLLLDVPPDRPVQSPAS